MVCFMASPPLSVVGAHIGVDLADQQAAARGGQELIQDLVQLVLVLDGEAGDAIGGSDGLKIRGAIQGHAEGAVVGGGALDLMDQTQRMVAEQDDLQIQTGQRMAASSFMAIWKEPSPHTTTVCRSGAGHLGPHGGGQGVAHGAQAAAGEQPPLLLGQVLAGKDLVLTHIHTHHRIVVQPGPSFRRTVPGKT